MKQKSRSFILHTVIAALMLFISLIDYVYRNFLADIYNPVVSLGVIVFFTGLLLFIYHFWYLRPYSGILQKIDAYYTDLLGEASATVEDSSKKFSFKAEIDSLEELLFHYKSTHALQTDLVCELTNKNKILDQTNKFADAIVQITSEILRSGDIRSILQLILDKAIEIIPNAQKGSILLYNNEFLEYKAMHGYNMEALQDFKFTINEIFQYNSPNLYEPIIINDVEEFNKNLKKDKFNVLKETRSFELKSCISCAIAIDGEFYGIINIDNVDNNYAFFEDHKPIIKYFAEQISVALKNAQMIDKILQLSHYDSLTGICNRAYFEEQLNKLHQESLVQKKIYTLALVDLNDLKHVNDNYGHAIGDKLIIAFTDYIANMENGPDIFGRFGGDEFTLAFANKSKEEVTQIMESVKRNFASNHFLCSRSATLHITFGYGLSTFPIEGQDTETIFINADKLMYIDKKHSKNLS